LAAHEALEVFGRAGADIESRSHETERSSSLFTMRAISVLSLVS
jgi:hypothetical protein